MALFWILQADYNLFIILFFRLLPENCMNRALLLVDPQHDFVEGALPVPGATKAMELLAAYLRAQGATYALKLVTLDWHPWQHCSFQENGGQWPRHCVAYSQGAVIWQPLLEPLYGHGKPVHCLRKGCRIDRDEYSIFQDESGRIALQALLQKYEISAIDICGLAGDVCVLNTLKDGIDIYGAKFFRAFTEFSPSLDGGTSLASFCAKELPCAR